MCTSEDKLRAEAINFNKEWHRKISAELETYFIRTGEKFDFKGFLNETFTGKINRQNLDGLPMLKEILTDSLNIIDNYYKDNPY